MIDVRGAVAQKYPSLLKYPGANAIIWLFKKLVHESEINDFLLTNSGLNAKNFIDAVLNRLNFCYKVSPQEKERIPAHGRVLIIANHPLGALDAISLLRMVLEVRSDVKVIANDLLMSLEPLKPLLLKLDVANQTNFKADLKASINALNKEEAVIIFPAGEVSRMRPVGVRDTKWASGAAFLAEKSNSLVVPVFISGRNSMWFYLTSMINKPISIVLLPNEMFLQKNKSVSFTIGEVIGSDAFAKLRLARDLKTKLLRKHLYRMAKSKKLIFETQKSVAHPQDRKLVRDELRNYQSLGKTTDDKIIYLCEYKYKSPLMLEIGRLRELSFRKVGEGTGDTLDLDKYDEYYKHLVLWDDKELEIVGSYRIGEGNLIMQKYGVTGFYSHSLFTYTDDMVKYLSSAIEMGRSFVQPKYWGTRALDYLWQGVGAYLAKNRDVEYMFGPVSLSASYPDDVKKLIVYFYDRYFGNKHEILAKAKRAFHLSEQEKETMNGLFSSGSYEADFNILRQTLKNYGAIVPVLYKQYSELCEEDGIRFIDFSVDPDFGNCVDGFILVELTKIKQSKRDRYLGESRQQVIA